MIVCFPAAGWLAQQFGWGVLYVVLGAVKLMLAVVVLAARRSRAPVARS
jgi:hypothetical protein